MWGGPGEGGGLLVPPPLGGGVRVLKRGIRPPGIGGDPTRNASPPPPCPPRTPPG